MTRTKLILLSLCSAALAACSASETAPSKDMTQAIKNADGKALGSLRLTDMDEKGTQVAITVSGISPGPHAMHFHEIGKCDAPDFKSSGGHYNPAGAAHGMKMADGPHAGDMMNIDVAADGTGSFTVINERVSITGEHGLPSLMDADGTALILHAGADDYESQPSGAAGARIGCAVIGR